MTDAIRELGHRLMRDGYVDNEPDALLAAIRIIAASSRIANAEPSRSSAGEPGLAGTR
ncbi:MAG TPA: hypothetical protein VFH38_07240 [Jatrophihabitans sp.]|nr:hypothetical protein [Jatrophihabitans sp.]